METRYDRQIMLPEIGEDGQRKLAKAKVLLVGVGGLGSPIATYLTAAGIGSLAMMDPDNVSLTNLHRQVLYDASQIGRTKVNCAGKRLRGLNSDVQLTAYPFRISVHNAKMLVSEYDIVVDGTDNFEARYLINDTCVALGKPYVYGSIQGFVGQVAVLCAGHATYRTLYPNEDEMRGMPHIDKGVVGVTPAVVGSVEASQVIQLICGYGEPLIDRLWTIDLRTMKSFIVSL
ncbi:MAG: HesA/MoeB/ThiF family protein [Prevotella sp.]|nr:HesA/MoeB/ThiF family protein [Prevotella sp.]